MQFAIEILAWIVIFLILRKHWHKEIVQKRYIEFVLALNVFACILYFNAMYNKTLLVPDAMGKIFLHGMVALIIYTLTKGDTYKKKKDD